jgi:hypothetical protein
MTFDFLGVWTSCVIQPCQVLLRWQISWSVLHGLQPHLHVSPTAWTTQHAVELVAFPTCVRNSARATSRSSTSATSSTHIWLVCLSWYYLQTAKCIKYDVNVYNVGLNFLDKIYASVNLINILSTYGRPLWSSGQSSWLQIQRSGLNSRCYKNFWEVVCLEQGPLSLLSAIEKLLERKSIGSGLEIREYGHRGSAVLSTRYLSSRKS